MVRAGRVVAMTGFVLTLLALVGGFTAMFLELKFAPILLMTIPVGFLLLFAGVVTAYLAGEPAKTREPAD